jgi:hypothetical protein
MDKGTKMIVLAGVLVAGYMYYKKTQEEEVSQDEDLKDEEDAENAKQEAPEEVPGCMTQGSRNYNSDATKDDGSCLPPLTCLPAMDSEGGGVGKYISVDGVNTPKNIETQRRQQLTDANLNVGDTIEFDGRPLVIKKFWVDAAGLKGAIQVENHQAEIGSHGYTANSKICF